MNKGKVSDENKKNGWSSQMDKKNYSVLEMSFFFFLIQWIKKIHKHESNFIQWPQTISVVQRVNSTANTTDDVCVYHVHRHSM